MRFGHLIRPWGLILHPLRALAATIALSLSCVTFAHAQKPFYPPPAPNYVPPKGAPLNAPPPPSFGDQLTATPGLNLGEAAPAQTSENFAFAAPNFVGDFIGGAAAGGGAQILGSILVGSGNATAIGAVPPYTQPPFILAGNIPAANDPTPFTLTNPTGGRGIADPNTGLITIVESNTTATFTTTLSGGDVRNLLLQGGGAVHIQNNAAYQNLANQQLQLALGTGGTTVFNTGTIGVIVDQNTNTLAANAYYLYDYVVALNLPSPGASSVVGIQKLVENGSPIPRDRILFNYSMFNNVRFTPGGLDVNRFVVGFEKTFLDETCSFELRAPFASTLNSDQVAGAAASTNTEFGNLTMYLKALMASGSNYMLGAGLAAAVPTADNINVRDVTGEQLVQVKNQSVHVLPYVGGIYTPSAELYTQAIMQIDTPASGNATLINNGQGLTRAGSLNDPTWLFASFNAGYWVYRSSPTESLSGVSPLVEVHYNTTLNNTDAVRSGAFQVGNRFGTLDMVNMVFGVNLEMYGRNYVSVAYVTPVSNGADRFFDGELRVLCNRYWW